MKLGVMKAQLPASLAEADRVFCYGAPAGRDELGWDLGRGARAARRQGAGFRRSRRAGRSGRSRRRAPGDQVLVMSNGGFGGVHQKLLDALSRCEAGRS